MAGQRQFALRMTDGGVAIEVDIDARAHRGSPPPRDARWAGPRTWLYVLDPLDVEHRQALLDGLKHVADQIEQAVPEVMVVIEVRGVDYSPADCPAEPLTAAMIGWAAEEFELTDISPTDVSPPGR